jgi:hypothetical protein
LRLLVRCQNGDRIASIRLRLLTETLHRWTHLIEALAHLGSRR